MRAGDRRSGAWRLGEEAPHGAGEVPDGGAGAARRALRSLGGLLTACAVVALYVLVLSRGDLP
ncbi:hypothetical protein OG233_08875 [Streptomyces sp. NBC_01218]|uniref:hypothetical protein n=1 Tax=unclassified Streptomyces TaxID=2593676 RepID=UPI0023BA1B4C|nr:MULTISPECIES: hypothetical protein [unclassified Streptomyces]WEH39590.1 hypothetical protein PZB77_08705 [Streptomyces sp. AM 2-1-1]WSQ51283.1 hypothetical protein OG233_08875 [Streptomyces sp. NBC_01218]